MRFDHLMTVKLALRPQLQWLWHSARLDSLIVGDESAAFSLPYANFGAALRLPPARSPATSFRDHHPCDLPIPDTLYNELIDREWHGFHFLDAAAYDHAIDDRGYPVGSHLRTLVYGPIHGHYVLHRSSNLVLGLRSDSVELLRRTADGFVRLGMSRTRGRMASAFAAHPTESLIAYGDNYGNFHAHYFSANGFGNTAKIAAKGRNASALQFIDGGRTLVVGGMGYLTTFSYADNKFFEVHEIPGAVRDFTWFEDNRILFVNRGIHGLAAYRYDDTGFVDLGTVTPDTAIKQMAVSLCLRYLAVSSQNSSDVTIYAISEK